MSTFRKVTRVARYGLIGGSIVGTGLSLHGNDYDLNSIGAVRAFRVAHAVFDIARIYQTNLYNKEWDKRSKDYRTQRSFAHQLGANRLLDLCCLNRGVYIKVGQHIGALEYLLPLEYVQTLKILHSKAPSNTLEEIYRVIRQDLKREPEEIFATFETEPLGVASLAQVHRATLRNGKEVAVKVQHHYVRGNANVDMASMEYACKIMGFLFPDFKLGWIMEETKKNLPIELDFLHEAKNTEKVKQHFKNCSWLKIPKIFWEMSTDRVLIMEYLEGGQVNDLDYIHANKIDPYDVSNKLGILYANMIFLNGYVHSDPHPGNILVHKNKSGNTDIVLLDHGLYANLTTNFMYEYSQLWLSILKIDRKAMRFHAGNLGIKGDLYGLFACMVTGRPWETIMSGIANKNYDEYEKELLQLGGALVLPDIADILEQVDRQMLLILKTNDLIRGIETTLQTQNRMTAFWVMSKCCIKSICNEECRQTNSYWLKFASTMHANWALFRINMFYLYRGLKHFNLYSTLKQLCA